MAICIIQAGTSNFSGSFIKAHEDLLQGKKVIVHNGMDGLIYQGRSIRYFYSGKPMLKKLLKLMPHFLYHKYVTKREESFKGRLDAIKGFVRAEKIDIFFTEFGQNGAYIAPFAKELGIPLIVHFHGHDAHRTDFIKPQKAAYEFMFSYASALVSVSPFMTRALVDLGAQEEKIIYNPYGPRPVFYDIQPAYGNVILNVGRFTDIKAPVLVLEAFRLFLKSNPEARLVMVGMGELLEAAKGLVRAWRIEENVTFTGGINHEDLTSYFADACIFVQHSVQPSYGDAEGTPNTILEASASALPVVSTKHAGINQAVVDGETGYLSEEYDIEGMSNHLNKLYNDRELCKKLGEQGRKHILQNFNINTHIGTLDKIISETLKSK